MSDRLIVRKPGFRIGASARLALSRDGAALATLGKRATLWDVRARQRIGSVHPFPHESAIDVSQDGERVAVKNTHGDVVILEAATLKETLRLAGRPYGEGSDVRFAPSGDLIVDGSWDGDLLVRDAASGVIVLHERDGRIGILTTTRDRETWLYSRNGSGIVIRRWPFTKHEAVPCTTSGDLLFGGSSTAAISDDGRFVATTGWERIDIWERADDRLEALAACAVPGSGTGTGLSWHPTGRTLAYAGGGQALLLTRELRVIWSAPFRYASDVAFSPNGDLLAIGDWSRGAVLAVDHLDLES
jgi:WD40 repeat protein